MIITTALSSPHYIPPLLCYRNFKHTAVSQEVGKLIIVMEMLADVGLGHFVDLASQTGMARLEHQEYVGGVCVFLLQSHRELHECSCGCFSGSLRKSSRLTAA